VVFGDIGTSPLYTVKECFSEFTGLKPVPQDVLGILSLITWALIVIVTLKYVLVVMRADNRGEGGVLALMALVSRRTEISAAPAQLLPHARHRGRRAVLRRLPAHPGDLGAERRRGPERRHARLRAAGRAAGARRHHRACSPSSIVGTAASAAGSGRSRWSGSRSSWCLACTRSCRAPQILLALSPHHAVVFFCHHGVVAFVALGAVTLAVTGAEALYADMGHFGAKPIRMAWLCVVLPRCSPTTTVRARCSSPTRVRSRTRSSASPRPGCSTRCRTAHGSYRSSPRRRPSPAPFRWRNRRRCSGSARG
jgi:KUP system potassium uptake protein